MVSRAMGKLTLWQCLPRSCCVGWKFFCISTPYDKIKLFFNMKDEVGYWCILFLTKSSVFKCKHLSLVFLRFWHYVRNSTNKNTYFVILNICWFWEEDKKEWGKNINEETIWVETYKRWVGRGRGMGGGTEGGGVCRHCYYLNLLVDTSKRSQNFVSHLNWYFLDFIMVKWDIFSLSNQNNPVF